MKKSKFFFVVLTLSLAITQAIAQDLSTTGTIGGKVADINGAAVPGATVTVEGATGERSVVTNSEGAFEIPVRPVRDRDATPSAGPPQFHGNSRFHRR